MDWDTLLLGNTGLFIPEGDGSMSQNYGSLNSLGPAVLADCLKMTEEIIRSPLVHARCHRALQYRVHSTEYVSRTIIQTEASFTCPVITIDGDHSLRPLPISPPPLPLMIFRCLPSVHPDARLFGAVAIYGRTIPFNDAIHICQDVRIMHRGETTVKPEYVSNVSARPGDLPRRCSSMISRRQWKSRNPRQR